MSESLVLLGIIIAAMSGLPGLFLRARTSMSGQWVTTLLAVLGGGAWPGGRRSGSGQPETVGRSCCRGPFPAPSSAWPWTACRPSSSCRSS